MAHSFDHSNRPRVEVQTRRKPEALNRAQPQHTTLCTDKRKPMTPGVDWEMTAAVHATIPENRMLVDRHQKSKEPGVEGVEDCECVLHDLQNTGY